jgi:hypothetical protein
MLIIDWKLALEGKGLRISRNKTEYIEYEFGGRDLEVEVIRRPMRLKGKFYKSSETNHAIWVGICCAVDGRIEH